MKQLFFAAILASAISMAPGTIAAQDHDSHTYTDTAHHDKHEWNANEDAAWKHYREEHHIRQEEFAKASRKQQQQYWNWRHEHPDEH